MKSARVAGLLAIGIVLIGCHETKPPSPTTRPIAEVPPYKRTPAELDIYLKAHAHDAGSIGERAVAIARQNIGQPYELYLLGEAPFETIDDQPVFCLEKSDCVVAVEHELAMSMSPDFPSFMRMLQRIRYKNGEIGVRTRNHYTETDWNVNNGWLLEDITDQVAGDLVAHYTIKVNREAFFKKRYKIDVPVPVETMTESYVPDFALPIVKPKLRTGDVFDVIKGDAGGAWAHDLGLIAVSPAGDVDLIHSNVPTVREETIEHYIDATVNRETEQATTRSTIARHLGFKFLRVRPDALLRLAALDGSGWPKVTSPADSPITFDAYVARTLHPATQPVASAARP